MPAERRSLILAAIGWALISLAGGCASAAPETSQPVVMSVVVASAGVAPERSALLIRRLEDGQVWQSGGARLEERFSPASTSKIPHTLIAIETGAVTGPEEWFEWDGQKRFVDGWNESQTFATAYKRSTVWIFQQVTPRIGSDALRGWLTRFGFGNGDTGPPEKVSQYWLTGPLAISAAEQVAFLTRLQRRSLPLSARTYQLAIPVMQEAEGEGWALYSKTGWFSSETEQDIGWYVGWLERPVGPEAGTYVFAFNMDMDAGMQDVPKRKAVVRAVLAEIGVLAAEPGGPE